MRGPTRSHSIASSPKEGEVLKLGPFVMPQRWNVSGTSEDPSLDQTFDPPTGTGLITSWIQSEK